MNPAHADEAVGWYRDMFTKHSHPRCDAIGSERCVGVVGR